MTKKSFILSFLCVAGVFVLGGGSCETTPSPSVPGNTAVKSPDVAATAPVKESLEPVIDQITHGRMEQAKELLAEQEPSEAVEQLKILMRDYDQLQDYRHRERIAAYQEQKDKLAQLQEQVGDQTPIDPNQIDEIMLALVRAREYAPEDEKDTLLDTPFIQRVMRQMQQQADADELQGRWLDAYTHNYYWLTSLFEDNAEYKEKGEELTELATIELMLKDSSCGETAVERYEGIEPEMYIRALKLLESNYVTIVDYQAMAQEGLKRCRLLGRVFGQTNEQLAWQASQTAVSEWAAGLKDLQSQVDQAAAADKPMEREALEGLFEDVLALDVVTLKLPEQVVIAQFTEASFAALDPFTTLVWPWNVKDFEKSMTQKFEGIGVVITKPAGLLKIESLLPDTPAYRAGLDADDEILAINGESTKEMTLYCVVDKIMGPKGTEVVLTIRRPSTGETKDYTLVRDRIEVDPLRGWTLNADGQWDYMIDPENGIGFIRLMQFTENSGPDIDAVLGKLETQGLNGVILDLRFNTGGYLQAAADVVDLFVKEGIIVKSNPRHGFSNYEIAHRSGTHPNYPLVVLINGVSASASEIVAGALQDPEHHRAVLVGERSYGKGSVQVITGYTGDGSQMKYTMAYYHLPSDQRVKNRYQIEKQGRKDWGIAPDVEVKMFSNEVRKMVDIQRDNDVLFQDGHAENEDRSKRHVLQEAIQADPQLSVAILVIRSQLAAARKTLAFEGFFDYSEAAETPAAETVSAQP